MLKIMSSFFFSGESPSMDILDIDKDIGNPQMCASYVVDIYSNLMAFEVGCCTLAKRNVS